MNFRTIRSYSLFSAIAALLVAGCQPGENVPPEQRTAVAAASPYIEAAVRDLLGDETSLVSLAGPNMCPGHFDMRPSQLRELAYARLLLRFDFQEGLDKKLAGRDISPKIVPIIASGGLCVPETYLGVCRQLANQFAADGTMSRSDADRRLAEIERRMDALRKEAAEKIGVAKLRDAPVLCSMHQEEFCRWLGLRVVSQFPSADTASTGEMDRAVTDADSAGVRMIVANRPEGRRAADALADRFDAPVVVFDNFPDPSRPASFDALVQANIALLVSLAAGS